MADQHVSPTWAPPSQDEQFSGTLDAAERNELPDSAFAFPAQRKEPLTSASQCAPRSAGSTRSRT